MALDASALEQKLQLQQHQQRRQKLLHDFYHRTKMLLIDADRSYIFGALKDYQMYRQIERLITAVRTVLDTPAKLDLLKDIRSFVLATHLPYYDRHVPYHNMAHPWQLSSQATMPRTKPKVYVIASPQQTPQPTPKTSRRKIINGECCFT